MRRRKRQKIEDEEVLKLEKGHKAQDGEICTFEKIILPDYVNMKIDKCIKRNKNYLVSRVKNFAKKYARKVSRMYLTVYDRFIYCEAFYKWKK